MATQRMTKSNTISIRISDEQRDLIDHAAEVLGKSRSDFMVETTSREAEHVLLDRTYFRLNEEQFDWFLDFIENPPPLNEAMKELLASRDPWE